jgi:hypothetical protein
MRLPVVAPRAVSSCMLLRTTRCPTSGDHRAVYPSRRPGLPPRDRPATTRGPRRAIVSPGGGPARAAPTASKADRASCSVAGDWSSGQDDSFAATVPVPRSNDCWSTPGGRCAAPVKAQDLAAVGGRDAAAGASGIRRAVNDLTDLVEATRRIVAQARQRVAGITPDGATRRVSLHEPDARPIAKGRLGRPVEFGYKAQVVDSDDDIVPDHSVQQG